MNRVPFAEWSEQKRELSESEEVVVKTEEDARALFRCLLAEASTELRCCICTEHVIYPILLDQLNCECRQPVYCGPCFALWRDADYRVLSRPDPAQPSQFRFVLTYANIHPLNEVRCACCRHVFRTYQSYHGNCSIEEFYSCPTSTFYLDLLARAKLPATLIAKLRFECLWCPHRVSTIQEVMAHMFGRNSCCFNPVPCQFCGKHLLLYSDDRLDYDDMFWRHVQTECTQPRCPYPMCSTFADRKPLTRSTFEWHQQIHAAQYQIAQLPYVNQLHMFDASESISPHPGWTMEQLVEFNRRLREFREWTLGCPYVHACNELAHAPMDDDENVVDDDDDDNVAETANAPESRTGRERSFTTVASIAQATHQMRQSRSYPPHRRRRRRNSSLGNSPSVHPPPPPTQLSSVSSSSSAVIEVPPPLVLPLASSSASSSSSSSTPWASSTIVLSLAQHPQRADTVATIAALGAAAADDDDDDDDVDDFAV